MNPICMTDEIAMTRTRSGVVVCEHASFGPYKLWSADEFTCPECGKVVVADFGKTSLDHYMGAFQDMLFAANRDGNLHHWYENAKQRTEQTRSQSPVALHVNDSLDTLFHTVNMSDRPELEIYEAGDLGEEGVPDT